MKSCACPTCHEDLIVTDDRIVTCPNACPDAHLGAYEHFRGEGSTGPHEIASRKPEKERTHDRTARPRVFAAIDHTPRSSREITERSGVEGNKATAHLYWIAKQGKALVTDVNGLKHYSLPLNSQPNSH